jgi:hypothetical protein
MTAHTNTIAKDLHGRISNFIFRPLPGKNNQKQSITLTAQQSELQLENNFRFTCACAFAKTAMLNEEKKAYYDRIAKKINLQNAYTAAICDYMRKGKIQNINTSLYQGRAGDIIHLNVFKKDFKINEVKVGLYYPDGRQIETGDAVQREENIFIYRAKKNIYEHLTVTVRVMLTDHIMNMVTGEVKRTLY